MSQRIYNTTDGPLIIDDEGHVLAAREHLRVKDLDVEPIAGHLEAGRLLDTTEAKAEGEEVDEAAQEAEAKRLADEEAAAKAAAAAKSKADKAANQTPRS